MLASPCRPWCGFVGVLGKVCYNKAILINHLNQSASEFPARAFFSSKCDIMNLLTFNYSDDYHSSGCRRTCGGFFVPKRWYNKGKPPYVHQGRTNLVFPAYAGVTPASVIYTPRQTQFNITRIARIVRAFFFVLVYVMGLKVAAVLDGFTYYISATLLV